MVVADVNHIAFFNSVRNWSENFIPCFESRDLPCFGQDVWLPLGFPPLRVLKHLNKWDFQGRVDIMVCFHQFLLATVI